LRSGTSQLRKIGINWELIIHMPTVGLCTSQT